MTIDNQLSFGNGVVTETAGSLAGTITNERCFHCLEIMPKYGNLTANLNGVSQPMCCIGCQAAAEFICKKGLMRFYQHRERLDQRDFFAEVASQRVKSGNARHGKGSWQYLDTRATSENFVVYSESGCRELTILIDGLYCSSCSWLIERALNGLSNDVHFQADIDSHSAYISVANPDVSLSLILDTIESLGYRPSVPKIGDITASSTLLRQQKSKAIRRIAVAGLGMMQVMTYATASYFGGSVGATNLDSIMRPEIERFFLIVSMLVATLVVFYSGKPFFENAINNIRNRHLGMDVSVSLAISGAYFPSVYSVLVGGQTHVYFDSAVMFVFFLSLGRYVEMRSRHRVSGAANSVQELLPATIEVERHRSNELVTVKIKPTDVVIGDQVQLKAGDVIPFDASISGGIAQVDESLATGESDVLVKRAGDLLIAGGYIVSGNIVIESMADWVNSSIAKIQKSLASAEKSTEQENQRSQVMSQYFIAVILVLTAGIGTVWFVIAPDRAFDVCLAMLIASCPCAFALAEPVGRSAAINSLRQAGVLITNNLVLSKLSKVTTWCFDKTGTLTRGRPSISQVLCKGNTSEDECLKIVACIERESKHVLASAFANIDTSYKVSHVAETVGQGIQARIGQDDYLVGKRSWVKKKLKVSDLEELTSDKSEIILVRNQELLAIIELRDQARSSASVFVSGLVNDNKKVKVLSGDHRLAVKRLCDELGIVHFSAALLPTEKCSEIQRLQNQGEMVAMVGDGINDAPVLAQADVSVAMASGSDLALHNSDVVLLNGNLENLNRLRAVSKRLQRVTKQNLTWAVSYNLLALPLAASGHLTPLIAAIGMSLSSLLVVLNATRIHLKKWK